MLKTAERFIIDKKGDKKAVVLTMAEYRRLLQLMEDLEDALDLTRAVKTNPRFRSYKEIRKELIRTRKLNV